MRLERPSDPPEADGSQAAVARAHLEIVRPVTRETSFLGLFPAASQEMIPIERVGEAVLRAVPLDPAVVLGAPNRVWRIESFRVGGIQGTAGRPDTRPPAPASPARPASRVGNARVREAGASTPMLLDNEIVKVYGRGTSRPRDARVLR